MSATRGLFNVVPALAVLVPLLDPTRWHRRRSTIRRGRTLRCWGTLIVLLRRVALGLTVSLGMAVTLRGTILLLRWLTVLLLRWLTILMLLRRRGATLTTVVVAIGQTTVTCCNIAVRRLRT